MFSCCNLMTIGVFSTLSAVTFFRTSWTKVGSKEKRMNRIESKAPFIVLRTVFQLVSLDGRNDWCGAFFAKFSFQTGPRDAGIGKCDCRLGCSQPSIWWLPESSPSGDYLINSLSMSSIHPFLAPPGAAPDLAPEGFTVFYFYPHILSSPNMIWYGESARNQSESFEEIHRREIDDDGCWWDDVHQFNQRVIQ